MLERVWIDDHVPGSGTMYLISGFSNYNGGVRFYEVFRRHIEAGGKIKAFLGGSANRRLSSRQVVKQLLEAGADVHLINRKELMHVKSYGTSTGDGDNVVVTSGNFTGPGMSQNVEMSVLLDRSATAETGFSWRDLTRSIGEQRWDVRQPLADETGAAWELLYDEYSRDHKPDVMGETDEVTMVIRLGRADTARITAERGTDQGKGSQYFWLSKDGYGFFPPLVTRNRRGKKTTFSTLIDLTYVDLGKTRRERVTFEAENNQDFRLGTSLLRYTGIAKEGDIAALSRIGERRYELRVFSTSHRSRSELSAYCINPIGHQGKRFGYIPNPGFEDILGHRLPTDAG